MAKTTLKSGLSRDTKFLTAVKAADVDAVKWYISQGQDVNVNDDKSDRSALYIACTTGNAELCGLLLAAGADPNQRTTWKSISLHAAAERGHVDCTKELLKYGSNVNAVNCIAESALHVASKRNHVAVLEELLAAGAKCRLQNTDKLTALQVAEAEGNIEAMNALMQRNAERKMTKQRNRSHRSNGETVVNGGNDSSNAGSVCQDKSVSLPLLPPTDDAGDDDKDINSTRSSEVSTRLRRALGYLQPDIVPSVAKAFQQELARNQGAVDACPKQLGKVWVENDDFTILGDAPINRVIWNKETPFSMAFEVEHKLFGIKVLKMLVCMKVKTSARREKSKVVYNQNKEWEIRKALPDHFNIEDIKQAFSIKTKSFRRFLPTVLPIELRERYKMRRDGVCLVTDKFPFTLQSIEQDLRGRILADDQWEEAVSQPVIGLLLYQLLRGLEHLAKFRIVHGAITSGNLLVDKQLRLVISGFDKAMKEEDAVVGDCSKNVASEVQIIRSLTEVPSVKTESLGSDFRKRSAYQNISDVIALLEDSDDEVPDIFRTILSLGAYLFYPFPAKSETGFYQCIAAQFIADTVIDPDHPDVSFHESGLKLRLSVCGVTIDGQRTHDRLRRFHNVETDTARLWSAFRSNRCS
eukprot:m.6141 g.6141  ORF g.6141 m.6141 type:complete len:638 (+) comp15025_c0_seq1:70-1983(+)